MNLPSNYLDVPQQSQDWFNARLGCVTSSRIADVVTKRKRGSEPLQAFLDMKWELAIEMLTMRPTEHYVSRWMQEGREKEPLARTEYEIRSGLSVDTIGFVYHPDIKYAGASPDGLVGDGLTEFKCPKVETHLQYIVDDAIPEQYLPQLIWQLACAKDRDWVDFVSFYGPLTPDQPELPEKYRLFIKRFPRTKEVDQLIAGYELEVRDFLEKVQELLAELKERVDASSLQSQIEG